MGKKVDREVRRAVRGQPDVDRFTGTELALLDRDRSPGQPPDPSPNLRITA